MARMRRSDVPVRLNRSALRRTGVSRPISSLQRGSGMRFRGPTLSANNRKGQSGRGAIKKGLKAFVNSGLGKEVLAASVQSLGENASNPYAKTFGSSLAESMGGEPSLKKKTNKNRQKTNSSSSQQSVDLSPEEYILTMKALARG